MALNYVIQNATELSEEGRELFSKFYELCLKVVGECGYTLYDLEYSPKNGDLRVTIMNDEGTALIDDCVKVDRALGEHIDVLAWMPETLTLEVSSPGLFRELKTLEHFKGVVDQDILISLKKKLVEEDAIPELVGEKKFLVKLVDIANDGIKIALEEKEYFLSFEKIKKANLETELEA